MDPNVALYRLMCAIIDGDRSEANEHFTNLRTWLHNGGFEPAWTHMSKKQFESYNMLTGRIGDESITPGCQKCYRNSRCPTHEDEVA